MSLRVRIAFLVSGLTALIVLISGAVIHQSTESDLEESLDKKLAFQIERVSDTRNFIGILERQRFFEQRIPPVPPAPDRAFEPRGEYSWQWFQARASAVKLQTTKSSCKYGGVSFAVGIPSRLRGD